MQQAFLSTYSLNVTKQKLLDAGYWILDTGYYQMKNSAG